MRSAQVASPSRLACPSVRATRLVTPALLVLPGAAAIYLAFAQGGFFPDAPAIAAIVALQVLVLRVLLADRPFPGVNAWVLVLATALGALALWQLLSATWSDAPARALIEFDRTLLYLAAVVLFGSLGARRRDLRWLVWGLAAGLCVVSFSGLISRILPEVWPTEPNVANDRLSFPLTYWNTLGLMAGTGLVLCLHLASRARGSWVPRVLGAAAIPPLAMTILFTFSRGSILVTALGVLLYLAVGRPRGAPSALLAALPTTAIALKVAYDADLLATENPTTADAVAQGHDVTLALVVCIVVAAVLRALLLIPDRRLARAEVSIPRRTAIGGSAAALVAAVVILLAAGVPGELADQYDRFLHGVETADVESGDFRSRLTDPANNGRVPLWNASFDGFADERLRGVGAGAYQPLWERERDQILYVTDAHGGYFETASELGLVGLVALLVAVFAILGGLAWRARGRARPVYAALLAIAVMWAVRSGVDWDWEMPAVTLPFFAAGAAALGARPGTSEPEEGRPLSNSWRMPLAIGMIALAVTPVLLAISQGRLETAAASFGDGDCGAAIEEALDAADVLAVRPEPYEIIGYCQVRRGFGQQAVRAMQQAVDHDPNNWEYHYGLAVAQAAAGVDPRPEARRTRELNPLEPLVKELDEDLGRARPERWPAVAQAARVRMYESGLLSLP